MRRNAVLIVGGACVVAGVALRLANELSETPEILVETPPERTPAPVGESEARPSPAAASVTPRPPSSAAPPTETSVAPREQPQVARIDESLTERLRGERVDPSWARETESAIASALAAPSFAGFRLDALTCAATLCRLALTAGDTVADVDGAVEELTSSQPFRHGGFVRFTSERALTMFIARKGHPLPPPPRT